MAQRTNEEWLAALSGEGEAQQDAIADLQPVLRRSALFYIQRRLTAGSAVATDEMDALAEDAAQEACLAVLKALNSFRGESRFLTWASAIAVGYTMTALRRRMWRDVSLDRVPDGWQEPASMAVGGDGWENPHLPAQRQEMWRAIQEVADTDLTDKQREVLNLVVINGVSAEEVAERMGSSAGALYKLTHDARRKLKAGLLKRGYTVAEILDAFGAQG